MDARAAAELAHRVAELGRDERVDHDRGPPARLLDGDVQVLDVLDARVADLHERLVGELRLERDHEALRGLPGRVGDDVELDRLALASRLAHRGEAIARSVVCSTDAVDRGRETMAFAELKARHSVVWGNGPYERVTNTIRDIHELVVERVDPQPGERLLDAATGTGAVAILAARRGAEVLGQDIAPVLIETARERAAEEGVDIDFEVGDAEAMTLRRRELRHRGVHVRRHVRARPRGDCRRARPRDEAGRAARPGLLEARHGHGRGVQDDGPVRPAPRARSQGARSPGGTSSTCGSCSATRFELEFEGHDSPLVIESPEALLGALLVVVRSRRGLRWKRSTRNVARSSTRRGSTSSRSTARATRSSTTASTC